MVTVYRTEKRPGDYDVWRRRHLNAVILDASIDRHWRLTDELGRPGLPIPKE